MLRRAEIFGFLACACLCCAARAAPLKCPDPTAQFSRDVQVNTKAKVAKLGRLGVGELENQTAVVVKPLLDQVPNSDRIILAQMMTSVFCQMIWESTLPDREKIDRFNTFQRETMVLVLSSQKGSGSSSAESKRPRPDDSPPSPSADEQRTSVLKTPRVNLRPGDEFRDDLQSGGAGPWMIVVPNGTFAMGSQSAEAHRDTDEGPVRYVQVSSFAASKFEVTFAQYDAHAKAAKRRLANDFGQGREANPVVDVSWTEAQAYVAWLSKQTGAKYRLLTEAEWEYVARAGTTESHPWPRTQTMACSIANLLDRRGKEARRQ